MRVLDDAQVSTGIHHAMYLIRTGSAHFKGQFAKPGRIFQEKSRRLLRPRSYSLQFRILYFVLYWRLTRLDFAATTTLPPRSL